MYMYTYSLAMDFSPEYICMYIYIHIYIYIWTSLTNSTDRPPPYIDHFMWVPDDFPYNTNVTIFPLPKSTASLNEPFKVGPMVGRFTDFDWLIGGSLYSVRISFFLIQPALLHRMQKNTMRGFTVNTNHNNNKIKNILYIMYVWYAYI